jgi:elongation factor P
MALFHIRAGCIAPRLASLLRPASCVKALQPRAGVTINASEIRVGDLIERDGALWRVTKQQFIKNDRRAFMQVEMRHTEQPTKANVRLRSDESVERVVLDTPARFQFMYATGDVLQLMNMVTFEQIELPTALLGDRAAYLLNDMVITIEYYKGEPARLTIPSRVTYTVAEVTALPNAGRVDARDNQCVLENGLGLKVPPHIKVGDKVVVDTESGTYAGKA